MQLADHARTCRVPLRVGQGQSADQREVPGPRSSRRSGISDNKPMKQTWFGLICGCSLALGALGAAFAPTPAPTPRIVLAPDAGGLEDFAAREVRRYLYLRTGRLAELHPAASVSEVDGPLIVVSRHDRNLAKELTPDPAARLSLLTLEAQQYWIKTLEQHGRNVWLVAGGDETGVLYGAYALAEAMGVRFYLHGDVIPDEPLSLPLPIVDQRGMPIFTLRGIQPFHDFPEGPDWWNRDDYLAVMAQLPKLKMNFFGLHTYPEGRPNAEPTVWIGLTNEFDQLGRVRAAYPASYQNTLRGNWGYLARSTSEFAFGAGQLFDRDAYSNDVMDGHCPQPATPEAAIEVFNRAAEVFRDAFTYARQLGIRTCIGTETPLVIPKAVQERLEAAGLDPKSPKTIQALYEGIFSRIMATHPLDYYWLWTPESWTWQGTKPSEVWDTLADIGLAVNALRRVEAPFQLATCGWVLGPQEDRAKFGHALPAGVAVSCINRRVGMDPVEPAFREISGRSKWAIPWLEDDPALTAPQLWVGRMLRDARDARRYGCDGLMGIHWRTKAVAPNLAALAQAAWDQSRWNTNPIQPPPEQRKAGPEGGRHAAFPNAPIQGTALPEIYRSVRYDVSAYHLPVPNGPCRVTLQFCEPHYKEAGKRVFGVKLEGQTVIDRLDILQRVGPNHALDFHFDNVQVTDGLLDIEFVRQTEFPSIAGIVVESAGRPWKINCGGPAVADYIADWPESESAGEKFPPTEDFYLDWARQNFGPQVALPVAEILAEIDSRLPRPAEWIGGPGGIAPDGRPWPEVRREYSFVERLEALAPRVEGAGNRARFAYWLNTFRYLRAMGELRCRWAVLNAAMDKARRAPTPDQRAALARQEALPARIQLLDTLRRLYGHLLATVSSRGELGTIANWEQHIRPKLIDQPGQELEKLLGEPLPPEATLTALYDGPTRVIVPTVRTSYGPGEPLTIEALVLSRAMPRRVTFHWRKLGEFGFRQLPFKHINRGVYRVQVPLTATAGLDFEYYVEVVDLEGRTARFPATAPDLCQTMIRMPLPRRAAR